MLLAGLGGGPADDLVVVVDRDGCAVRPAGGCRDRSSSRSPHERVLLPRERCRCLPITWPCSLIATARLVLPPRVPRSVIRPVCHRNACPSPVAASARSDDLAAFVDRDRRAVLAAKRAEVDHPPLPPQEGVLPEGRVWRARLGAAEADDLAALVDRGGAAALRSRKAAEIGHLPVLPHKRVPESPFVVLIPTIFPRSLIALVDVNRPPRVPRSVNLPSCLRNPVWHSMWSPVERLHASENPMIWPRTFIATVVV